MPLQESRTTEPYRLLIGFRSSIGVFYYLGDLMSSFPVEIDEFLSIYDDVGPAVLLRVFYLLDKCPNSRKTIMIINTVVMFTTIFIRKHHDF